MAKTQPDEQYTPRGAKIPIPERGEFRCHLDHVLWGGCDLPYTFRSRDDRCRLRRGEIA